ncbi:TetR/AcrR family transcriptional regulator [Leifsonia sp. AG29]|uniref:TetR/AcrR family transcriptional regulator n=1 Tax=Leifsonia sp. AG29 TaxID=2598860 RepID=UPI001E38A44A|nr:TetR/AcrR family transcriptional regulator [Leifsonia sp. AG29]
MPDKTRDDSGMTDTEQRILDVAIEVLGADLDAGMGDIASAAGVVRRTVYSYFPSRSDLVRALTERAVREMSAILGETTSEQKSADVAWSEFVTRLWPLTHRYRVLVSLRRGEFGDSIHSLLVPIEKPMAELVARGQAHGAFGRHLPPDVLSQVAWSSVFTLADHEGAGSRVGARAAAATSLLLLGVPHERVQELTERTPDSAAS